MEYFFDGTLSTLQYAVSFVLVLSVLVFIHEWGHYWVAKRCGVRIDSFSIGFGPEILGFHDRDGTRWKLSIIPLGGYVKMHGDADPASMPSEAVAMMSEEEKEYSFFHKTVGQRAAIVFAGPAANFLFAIAVFTITFMTIGQVFTPALITEVVPGMPAESAGFKAGDLVTAVDGEPVLRFEDLQKIIRINAGHQVNVTVNRDGQKLNLPVTPTVKEIDDGFGGHGQIGLLGVQGPKPPARISAVVEDSAEARAGLKAGDLIVAVDGQPVSDAYQVQKQLDLIAPDQPARLTVARGLDKQVVTPEQIPESATRLTLSLEPDRIEVTSNMGEAVTGEGYVQDSVKTVASLTGVAWSPIPNSVRIYRNPFHAVYQAVAETWSIGAANLTSIGQLFTGDRSTKELGGPLKIARISGEVAKQSVFSLLHFMVLLSVSLGLINLLPVPVLDGGHLVFYGIETLRGQPLSLKAQEYSFRVGLALVLCLMIFATWNDLAQWFGIGA